MSQSVSAISAIFFDIRSAASFSAHGIMAFSRAYMPSDRHTGSPTDRDARSLLTGSSSVVHSNKDAWRISRLAGVYLVTQSRSLWVSGPRSMPHGTQSFLGNLTL